MLKRSKFIYEITKTFYEIPSRISYAPFIHRKKNNNMYFIDDIAEFLKTETYRYKVFLSFSHSLFLSFYLSLFNVFIFLSNYLLIDSLLSSLLSTYFFFNYFQSTRTVSIYRIPLSLSFFLCLSLSLYIFIIYKHLSFSLSLALFMHIFFLSFFSLSLSFSYTP